MTSFEELRFLQEGKDAETRPLWEVARWMQFHQTHLSPFVKAHHQPKTPMDIVRFPWDIQEPLKAVPQPKGEEIDELNRLLMIHRNKQQS